MGSPSVQIAKEYVTPEPEPIEHHGDKKEVICPCQPCEECFPQAKSQPPYAETVAHCETISSHVLGDWYENDTGQTGQSHDFERTRLELRNQVVGAFLKSIHRLDSRWKDLSQFLVGSSL